MLVSQNTQYSSLSFLRKREWQTWLKLCIFTSSA